MADNDEWAASAGQRDADSSDEQPGVTHLEFDCDGIDTKDAFWDRFLDIIGAMDDHGQNLDALADSMGGGCSKLLNPPYVLNMISVRKASGEGLKMIKTVAEYALEDDYVEEGVKVNLQQ